tara:strand:+ start:87100 stop:88002 length:903 start_codon:yes stop_codon:yes gene_type:complete
MPKKLRKGEKLPVVLVLAGFSGVGNKYLNVRFKDPNFAEVLDQLYKEKLAPKALYVLVDAMTYWGGSQFINSKGTGRYEDFLCKEVYSALHLNFPVESDSKHWCVMGGSSGGYGALHLSSKYPEKYGLAIAIAPDSFFDASLMPEILTAMISIEKLGGVKGVKEELESGKLMRRREAHTILNAIGMGTCYAPDPKKKGEVRWPIDSESGLVVNGTWKQWLKHDPIHFLKARKKNVLQLRGVYLDVGDKDQYHLQYGTRQIRDALVAMGAKVKYSEFKGNHFDIGDRRPAALKWLNRYWRS